MNKYKLNFGRIITNIIVILIIFIIFNALTSQIFGLKYIKTKNFIIKSGDTLWNISSNICKEDSSLNIQDVISDIKKLNNLNNSNISEGDTIQIPIYS